jgi:hypothetical protein
LMAVCKGMVPASSTLRWSVQHYFQVSQDIREIFIWDCRSCSGHQKISQELFNVSLSPPVFIRDSEIIPKMIAKIDSAGPPVFYGSRLRDILCVLTRQLVQVSWTSTLIHKSCRTLNPQLPGTQSRPPSSSALPLPQKQLLPPTSWITSSTNPWTVSITSQTIRPIPKFHWSARRVSLQSVLCLMHTPNWTLPRYPPSSLSHRIQVLYPWKWSMLWRNPVQVVSNWPRKAYLPLRLMFSTSYRLFSLCSCSVRQIFLVLSWPHRTTFN